MGTEYKAQKTMSFEELFVRVRKLMVSFIGKNQNKITSIAIKEDFKTIFSVVKDI